MTKRIIVAEDQVIIRKLIQMTLSLKGFEVHEVDNGTAAVELATQLRPDCILLDVMMPGAIDGIEACRRLRQSAATKNIPIIMLSAKGQAADQSAGMEAGASAYMTKPFEPSALVDLIIQWTKNGQS